MRTFQIGIAESFSKSVKGSGKNALTVSTAALLSGALMAAKPAEAVTVDIFLIAEHSTPASGSSANFSIMATDAFQLSNLNNNFNAKTATKVGSNFSFDVDAALTFNSQETFQAPITDFGEIGLGTADYVNSEISTWDNVSIPSTTVDPDEQIDFGRNASVTFNPVPGGFTDLIISEVGGLNPFSLALCSDAACTNRTPIFGGFSNSLTTDVLALDQFASSDTGVASEMDQTWLFRFQSPVFDYVRIQEFDDRNTYTGARLQTDFIGVGGISSGNATVPVPAGLPLLASGLALLGWAARRRKS